MSFVFICLFGFSAALTLDFMNEVYPNGSCIGEPIKYSLLNTKLNARNYTILNGTNNCFSHNYPSEMSSYDFVCTPFDGVQMRLWYPEENCTFANCSGSLNCSGYPPQTTIPFKQIFGNGSCWELGGYGILMKCSFDKVITRNYAHTLTYMPTVSTCTDIFDVYVEEYHEVGHCFLSGNGSGGSYKFSSDGSNLVYEDWDESDDCTITSPILANNTKEWTAPGCLLVESMEYQQFLGFGEENYWAPGETKALGYLGQTVLINVFFLCILFLN